MARPCLVCTHPNRQAIETLVVNGASDYEIGRRFNVERVSIGRHRRRHLIKPAQDRLAIVSKGSQARREREQLAAAAYSDAPTPAEFVEAFFSLRAQTEKLQRIEDRLERMAALAEDNQSPNGVAQVAAQQLRSVEVGSKVAGIGGYAPARAADLAASGQIFSIDIHFASTGETVSISTPVRPAIPENVVDGELEDEHGFSGPIDREGGGR